MNEATLGGIDHVAVAVHDADAAANTFSELLGYRLAGDEVVDAAGVRLVFLTSRHNDADAQLQLVQPLTDGPVARFLTERGEGLHHVCLRTTDLDTALRRLGQRDRSVFVGGRGRACAFLAEEPHGLRIELTEVAPHEAGTTAPGLEGQS